MNHGKGWRRARTDYPEGVLAIYDAGTRDPDIYSRYCVVYTPEMINGELYFEFGYFNEGGEGYHGEAKNYDRPRARFGNDRGAGKTIAYEDLPESARTFITRDLESYGELEERYIAEGGDAANIEVEDN